MNRFELQNQRLSFHFPTIKLVSNESLHTNACVHYITSYQSPSFFYILRFKIGIKTTYRRFPFHFSLAKIDQREVTECLFFRHIFHIYIARNWQQMKTKTYFNKIVKLIIPRNFAEK